MITSTKLKRQSDIVNTWAIWDREFPHKYRYCLFREWNPALPRMVIIGLNPSAADDEYDDRTVRRCINFARREGCGSLSMLNAFALRATNPKELYNHPQPIGELNDDNIYCECMGAAKIVIAWGKHGLFLNRQREVLILLKGLTLYCFGTNEDGTPKHPLYLGNNTKLEIFKG